jgi:hypothetical protein
MTEIEKIEENIKPKRAAGAPAPHLELGQISNQYAQVRACAMGSKSGS